MSPITALAYVLTMGDVSRFPHNKQVASCLGLHPARTLLGRTAEAEAITVSSRRSYREQPMGAPGWRERDDVGALASCSDGMFA